MYKRERERERKREREREKERKSIYSSVRARDRQHQVVCKTDSR